MEINMQSEIASIADFAPPTHGVIDKIRVRLALWMLEQSARAAARRQLRFVQSLDARTRYDIGATDIIEESALYYVAKYHPYALTFGGLHARQDPRAF
jgi:hypothetical protein